MTVAIYLPLVFGVLFARAGRWTASGVPGTTARGLTIAALLAAVASTWSLVLLALTLVDDLPPLSALDGHATFELPEPVAGPVASVAAVLLLGAAYRLVRNLGLRRRTIDRLREAGEPAGGMVIADWSMPMAVAIPGKPGHVLVTSGMLRVLDAQERAVMFAHERAHLAHRHHVLVTVAAAAAAVNPLLIPVRVRWRTWWSGMPTRKPRPRCTTVR